MVLTNVFNNLPELQTFHVDNVDDFSKEAFNAVFSRFATYKGLERLELQLTPFELEPHKEVLANICRIHFATLKYFSLAKNKVTNALM
jgi:hypothetical protein